MHDLSRHRTRTLLEACSGAEIAVVGDVMLDRYFWGTVTRVSPEAPVPVVDIADETYHLGGAANVAANLLTLGTTPLLYGVVGDDASGRRLQDVATELGLDAACITVSTQRPTTVKTRVFGNNQQIVRLDREHSSDLHSDDVASVLETLTQHPNLAGIVFADYNKGMLSAELIESVMQFARTHGIKTFVDPKHKNFLAYRDAFLVKPNRKEAQDVLGYSINNEADVRRAGNDIMQKLNCENVLLTLGAEGMMLFERDGGISSVPTRAHGVADVSGAGDTTIATFAAMIVGGASVREAAAIANAAAGVVVEVPGIVPITREALLDALPKED